MAAMNACVPPVAEPVDEAAGQARFALRWLTPVGEAFTGPFTGAAHAFIVHTPWPFSLSVTGATLTVQAKCCGDFFHFHQSGKIICSSCRRGCERPGVNRLRVTDGDHEHEFLFSWLATELAPLEAIIATSEIEDELAVLRAHIAAGEIRG